MPDTDTDNDLQREDRIDERLNKRFDITSRPGSQGTAKDLQSRESNTGSAYTQAGIDQAHAFANDKNNASAALGSQEDNPYSYAPGGSNKKPRKKMFKSAVTRSAVAFIVVLILGPLGAFLMFISNPLLSIVENATLSNDSRSSFLERRLVKVLDRKAKHATDKNIAKSIETVSGRLNAFPNKLLLEMDKAGLKPVGAGDYSSGKGYSEKPPTHVEVKDTGKRIAIPDLPDALRNDSAVRTSVAKAVDVRFRAYTGKFMSKVFFSVRNISKSGGVIDGTDEKTDVKKLNEKIKTLTSAETEFKDANAVKSRLNPLLEDVLKKQATKATKTGDPILMAGGAGCMAINGPRTIASVIRGVLLGQAVLAASDIVLSPGHKIKAGEATPEEAGAAASALTATDSNGKSALDSPILQSALGINKNKVELGAWVAAYSFMSSALVQSSMVAGAASRPGCDAILSPQAFAVSAAISAASAATGPGAAAYNAAKAAAWVLIKFKGAELAINALAPLAATVATLILAKTGAGDLLVKLIQYNAKQGEDLGNYLGMALLAFFSDAGLKAYTPALTKEQLATYNATVLTPSQLAYQQEIRSNLSPFDTSSQYTFMGSIASKFRSSLGSNPMQLSNALSSVIRIPSMALSFTSPNTFAAAPTHDYSEECGFGTSKVALNAACTPYIGMPAEFIDMDSEEAESLIDSDAIDQTATDPNDAIDPESELGLKLSECASGAIEVLDGCTIQTVSGGGSSTLSPSEIAQQCSNVGDIENDDQAKQAYENCVEALSNTNTRKQPKSARKNAADFNFATDLQIESILSGEDDEPIASANASAGEFTMSSYNILRVTDKKHTAEVCRALGLPNNQVCTARRIQNQANIINGKTELNNKPFDLVMTQEMTPENYREMKKVLPDFDSSVNEEYGIFWRKSTFPEKFEEGTVASNSGSGRTLQAPWVGLKSASGQTVYALSFHYSSFAQFNGSPAETTKGAKRTLDWVRSKNSDDAIVVIGGDAGYFSRSAARVFNGSGILENAGLMAEGKPSKGDEKAVGADQLYITPKFNLTVQDYKRPPETPGSIVVKASDHAPVYGTVVIPGVTSAATSAGNISWPVDKKWWTRNKTEFIEAHGVTSGSWTNGKAGIAADLSLPAGTPVYAMFGGAVSRADLRSSVGGPHGLAIKSNVQGGVLEVAYAHGPRTDRAKSYNAGDKIMNVGSLGNSTGNHVHIDMSFNGKAVCPQDVFIAMGNGQTPNFSELTKKAKAPCGRVQYAFSPA